MIALGQKIGNLNDGEKRTSVSKWPLHQYACGERIRIDFVSEANHNLILWLDKPDPGNKVHIYKQISF